MKGARKLSPADLAFVPTCPDCFRPLVPISETLSLYTCKCSMLLYAGPGAVVDGVEI